MSKRQGIFISSVSVLIILFSFVLFSEQWCHVGTVCNRIEHFVARDFEIVYYLVPSILIFSLLTYKMHERVFRTWLRFAYWWVPLSIILTLITPDGSGGWGIPSVIDRGFVAFIFAALFTIISLIIIVWKFVATRKR